MTLVDVSENITPAHNGYEDLLEEEDDHDLLEDSDMDDDDIDLLEKSEVAPTPINITVPPGWSCEGKGSDTSIKSPGGQLYKSRRHALVEMINSGKSSEEEISEMRSMMKHEGWEESDRIPRGWMMKEGVSGENTQFLGIGGEFFESLKDAMEFVEKYKKYFYQEDIDKMYRFQELDFSSVPSKNIYTESDSKDGKWTGNHPSVPAGWLFKCIGNFGKNNVNIRVMSPDGKVFQSRRSALKFMIEQNSLEDQIKEMRNCLEFDGWLQDENLPRNWLYKKNENDNHVAFIDASANYLRNREEAFRSLEKNENSEFLNMVKSFCQSLTTVYSKANDLDGDWIQDHPSVPPGWLVKEVSNGSQSAFTYKILSPSRVWFPSHRLAYKHMIDKGYSEDMIKVMRDGMKYDGWLTDPALPVDWLYKARRKTDNRDSRRGNSISFINCEGNYFRSRESALKHLKQKEDHKNVAVFLNFNEKQSDKLNTERNIDASWSSDHSVPSGWMVKKRKFGKSFSFSLISPEGKIFQGRRPALKFMIKKEYPEKQIRAMRKCLKNDGWTQDPALPINWFFKAGRYDHLSFIDSAANYFKSREDAFRQLKQRDDSISSDRLKTFLENRKTVYNKGMEIDAN